MTPETTLVHAALVATALLLGAMLFFSFGVAPMAFRALERPQAARLMQALFPLYYLVIVALGAAAALCLAIAGDPLHGGTMAFVAAAAALLRQGLLPRLDALRPLKESGDALAQAGFARLHRASMVVNLVQIVAVAAVLSRLLP
jgi:hypothetical protein